MERKIITGSVKINRSSPIGTKSYGEPCLIPLYSTIDCSSIYVKAIKDDLGKVKYIRLSNFPSGLYSIQVDSTWRCNGRRPSNKYTEIIGNEYTYIDIDMPEDEYVQIYFELLIED